MQATVDAHLIGCIGIAFQAWLALADQRGTQRPGRVIQTRSAAKIQHAKLFDARSARGTHQLATALHIDAHHHLQLRREHRVAEHRAHDCQYCSFLHCPKILIQGWLLRIRVATWRKSASLVRNTPRLPVPGGLAAAWVLVKSWRAS